MTLRRGGFTLALLVASWGGLDVRAAEAQCTYSVSPTTVSASSTGLNSSIGVTTGSSCAWTPVSTWPGSITSPGCPGWVFNFTVANTPAARAQAPRLSAARPSPCQSTNSCTYGVSPMSVSRAPINRPQQQHQGHPPAQLRVVPVSTVAPGSRSPSPGCPNWARSTSPSPQHHRQRAAPTMTVGGQTVTVTQSADSCLQRVAHVRLRCRPAQQQHRGHHRLELRVDAGQHGGLDHVPAPGCRAGVVQLHRRRKRTGSAPAP